jgi:hypothetical protein
MGNLINIGSTSLDKGKIKDGLSLMGWDSVDNCSGEDCSLYDRCKHIKSGKCAVQVAYINNMCETMIEVYKHMDEGSLFKVGMHLMPLYSYLCKMKIVEAGVRDMVNITNKGIVQIHPIYKEIRETLKTILRIGRDLDLFYRGVPQEGEIDLGDENNGSRDHYKRISELPERKKVVR